ncbi:hypothetical protein PENTCL1PPCAC_7171 [Pristionchus entomophagus]|uniref:SHSP domain-containing protein n=1 Tax=Pristionchus entomophagus TaxID=358040 RepID=A0AAV5SZQ8_9BILA|nr:hypothetical protein PENTCL1PPCAC_7171 [Pristionchus entomophagus]
MFPFGVNPIDRMPNVMIPYWPSLPSDRIFNTGGIGEVINTNEKFSLTVDVSQFKPNELEVNVTGRELSISGKHEQRADEHGSISRSFNRKYSLPEDVDLESIRSKIVDGKLMIEATKVGISLSATRSITISSE